MLESLGAVVIALGLGFVVAGLIFFWACLRGIEAALQSLPWMLAAFIATVLAVLWVLYS